MAIIIITIIITFNWFNSHSIEFLIVVPELLRSNTEITKEHDGTPCSGDVRELLTTGIAIYSQTQLFLESISADQFCLCFWTVPNLNGFTIAQISHVLSAVLCACHSRVAENKLLILGRKTDEFSRIKSWLRLPSPDWLPSSTWTTPQRSIDTWCWVTAVRLNSSSKLLWKVQSNSRLVINPWIISSVIRVDVTRSNRAK